MVDYAVIVFPVIVAILVSLKSSPAAASGSIAFLVVFIIATSTVGGFYVACGIRVV